MMNHTKNPPSIAEVLTFNDSYAWNEYHFFFGAELKSMGVVKKQEYMLNNGEDELPVFYSLDQPIVLSFADDQITVSSSVEGSHPSFREFLILDKALTYPSVTLFNFENTSGPQELQEKVISLRAGGLGVILITDTDPVYYQMHSFELGRPTTHKGMSVQLKAIEISKGVLKRTNEYDGDPDTEFLNTLCFNVFYEALL